MKFIACLIAIMVSACAHFKTIGDEPIFGVVNDQDGNPLEGAAVCVKYGNVDFFSAGEDRFRGCAITGRDGKFVIPKFKRTLLAGGTIFDTDSLPSIHYMHPEWGYHSFMMSNDKTGSDLVLTLSKDERVMSNHLFRFCREFKISYCDDSLNKSSNQDAQ